MYDAEAEAPRPAPAGVVTPLHAARIDVGGRALHAVMGGSPRRPGVVM